MTEPLLRMEGISKSFPGVRALEHVDFQLEAGQVHALIGKNGAGKSTLIKILGGVQRPDSGRVLLDGHPVELPSPHAAHDHGIAIVHQELSLVPSLTVAENVFLGRWRTGRAPVVQWRRLFPAARGVLARLDSGIDPRAVVGSLSVAQQQTVEIAKALSRNPKILVMDEPTSALSDRDGERLLRIVRGLAGQGVGIVYISHRLVEIEAVADHVTVLRDGRTVGDAPMRELDRRAIVQMMLGEELSHSSTPRRAPAGGEVVLSVRNLSRAGALDDVSFDVRAGEVLGIAGLVGAGRSELVRAIFGRDPVDRGEISVHGRRVARPTPRLMKRLGVGFLPEDRKRQALVLGLSVRENMALTVLGALSRFAVVNPRREQRLVGELVRDLHVAASSPEVAVGTLSGGNQQKVVIGKWLATNPRLLILDEPTRGVDVHAKAQIFRILDSLSARGVAVIFISSELEEVLTVSHRILTMARGRIVSETEGGVAEMEDILLSAAGG